MSLRFNVCCQGAKDSICFVSYFFFFLVFPESDSIEMKMIKPVLAKFRFYRAARREEKKKMRSEEERDGRSSLVQILVESVRLVIAVSR